MQTTSWWLPEGKVSEEEGKGVKYIARERDQTLSGEHTMQYAENVLQNSTLEMYILSINVAQ